MEIREGRAQEYEAIGELTLAAYRAIDGILEPKYEKQLLDVAHRAETTTVLVAGDGTELLGAVAFVSGAGPYADFGPDVASFRMLAVSPAAQQRGAGTALVQACIDRARAAGFKQLALHTTPHMKAAHRIYERCGFVRAPDLDYPDPHYDLLAFVLDL